MKLLAELVGMRARKKHEAPTHRAGGPTLRTRPSGHLSGVSVMLDMQAHPSFRRPRRAGCGRHRECADPTGIGGRYRCTTGCPCSRCNRTDGPGRAHACLCGTSPPQRRPARPPGHRAPGPRGHGPADTSGPAPRRAHAWSETMATPPPQRCPRTRHSSELTAPCHATCESCIKTNIH